MPAFLLTLRLTLIAERGYQPYVIVRVATLDDDPGVRPTSHIWTAHEVPWLAYDGVARWEEWEGLT